MTWVHPGPPPTLCSFEPEILSLSEKPYFNSPVVPGLYEKSKKLMTILPISVIFEGFLIFFLENHSDSESIRNVSVLKVF